MPVRCCCYFSKGRAGSGVEDAAAEVDGDCLAQNALGNIARDIVLRISEVCCLYEQ
jgi:hypothetical protein